MQLKNYNTDSSITHLEKYKNYAIQPGQVMIVKDKSGYCPYFQVFYTPELLGALCRLDTYAQVVFFNLAINMIEGNKVSISGKEEAKETGMKASTFYNCLWRLKKVDILRKKAPKRYLLNPFLVWKGSQAELLQARNEWKVKDE